MDNRLHESIGVRLPTGNNHTTFRVCNRAENPQEVEIQVKDTFARVETVVHVKIMDLIVALEHIVRNMEGNKA